jgi:hypothetical protein
MKPTNIETSGYLKWLRNSGWRQWRRNLTTVCVLIVILEPKLSFAPPANGPFPANSFAARVDFAANNPISLAVGDLDGDGKPDLVSPVFLVNSVQVFRNTTLTDSSSVTFAAPLSISTAATLGSYDASIGDLDRDGRADLAITIGGGVVLLRNSTSGSGAISFRREGEITVGRASYPNNAEFVDLDDDGRLDLLFLNHDDGAVRLYRNRSDPGSLANAFGSSGDFAAIRPEFVIAGDVNQDGRRDILYTANTSVFLVHLNAGDFSFRNPLQFRFGPLPPPPPGPSGPYHLMALADLDCDGAVDVIIGDWTRNAVSVWRNTARSLWSVSFAEEARIPLPGRPTDVEASDLDGDGKLDIAVTSGDALSLIRNLSAPGYLGPAAFASRLDLATPAAYGWHRLAAGDVNGDTKPDLVVASLNANSLSIFRNALNFPPMARPQSVSVDEDTPLAMVLDVFDLEGDPLSYVVNPPAYGSLSGAAPNLVYHPATNWFGTDGFTYQVSDDHSNSAVATVQITVIPVNDPPLVMIAISPLLRFPRVTNHLILSKNNTDAAVVLDGSDSSDVENDPLGFVWKEGDTVLATKVVATNVFAVKTHTASLFVSDGKTIATSTITFDVITPSAAVGIMAGWIAPSNLSVQRRRHLLASLRVIAALFDHEHFHAGIVHLQIFQRNVRILVVPHDPQLAADLTTGAQQIINALDDRRRTNRVLRPNDSRY